MASSDAGRVVLSMDDVYLSYRVGPRHSLRDRVSRGGHATRDIEAVRGISLTVSQGDVVGIIGLNGSGKSTLLRGCAGLLPLRSGEILATSRPTLLSVGGLLNQKMTGRANLKMGCMALGLSSVEVDERMADMVEFSGLGDAIDMPMFTYSTGMRSRVNFTMCTARTPEILLLDEILSGGDQSFQAKAINRINEIREQAGAVMLVSHSLREIRRSATRVVWVSEGKVRAEGESEEVILAYESTLQRGKNKRKPASKN